MMKKLIALLLALVLILSLAACSDAPTSDDKDSKKQSQSEDKNKNDKNDKDDKDDKGEISFTEVVVVDNEECVIKITDLDPDNMWGFTLKAELENKSSDKTYMFSVDSASINGVQANPLFASEVAPGKKSNEDISFMDDALEENGIGDFTDIELTFRVYDTNDWSADPVAEETVHIYPYGEENAVKYEREAQDSDNVLIDNDDVTVIVTGYEHDEIWGYSVNVFLINKSDKNLMFSADETSLNGYMINGILAADVSVGKCAFETISWFASDLEDNSITDVEDIEFTLSVSDADDWLADDLVNEKITLNP